jgi:plastocyanin
MNDLTRMVFGVRGGRFRPLSLTGVAIIAVGLLGAGAFVAAAQQATPPAESQAESQTFPAAIYNGTCAQLGAVAYPLAPVGLPEGSQTIGQTAVPAYESTTGLENAVLSDLVGGPFAIAVGADNQSGQPIVACGEIGGTKFGDTLLLGLQPAGDSGYAGVALLSQAPSTTTLNVVVYLTAIRSGVAMPVAASPAASPATTSQPTSQPTATTGSQTPAATGTATAGSGQAQNQVTITLNDIYFNPNVITIPANTPVTVILENKGVTTHNFSITNHNNPNVKDLNISVTVDSGQTQQTTINAPAGTYYFFCNIPGHEAAGMFGYLIVKDGAAIATEEATVTPPAG